MFICHMYVFFGEGSVKAFDPICHQAVWVLVFWGFFSFSVLGFFLVLRVLYEC